MFIHNRLTQHLYLCHLLVLFSPTLMMHGHTKLKTFLLLVFLKYWTAELVSAACFSFGTDMCCVQRARAHTHTHTHTQNQEST